MKNNIMLLIFAATCAYGQSQELIDVQGAIIIANSENPDPAEGTIRWTGEDFEGWNGKCWISLTTGACSSVCDADGNIYPVVNIGNQTWMAENLRTSKYQNGDPILHVPGNQSGVIEGAYNWYDNDSTNYNIPYGRLYNWYAVEDNRNICPLGYHVPSLTEWNTLSDNLGGNSLSGGEMKETGTTHWNAPNTGATNSSGLTMLPGGWKYFTGSYSFLGEDGFYWTSTEENTNSANFARQYNDSAALQLGPNDKRISIAIRCIKD